MQWAGDAKCSFANVTNSPSGKCIQAAAEQYHTTSTSAGPAMDLASWHRQAEDWPGLHFRNFLSTLGLRKIRDIKTSFLRDMRNSLMAHCDKCFPSWSSLQGGLTSSKNMTSHWNDSSASYVSLRALHAREGGAARLAVLC